MMNKNLVRKIILEEILKNVKKKQMLNEVILLAAGGAALLAGVVRVMAAFTDDELGAKVDKITTHTPANNIYLVLKDMLSNVTNAIIITDTEAKALARELADETVDKTGTGEDEIATIIQKSKSQINFAKVCIQFHAITNKSFKDVFRDELSGGMEILGMSIAKHQKEYVIDPILDLPFIYLDVDGTETPLTESEFLEQVELAGSEEEEEEAGDCNPPKGFEAPYFTNAMVVMNDYAAKKEIPDWTDGPVQEDWASGHQDCWEKFVAHVFENCDLYKNYNLPNGGKTWKEVSETLIGDFPGYTYNKSGFLAFCLDAYCCEKKYGNEAQSTGGGGGGGGGGGEKPPPPPPPVDGGDQTRGGSGKFTIVLDQTNKNFKGSGFSSSRGDIDELIIGVLKTQIKQSGLNTGVPSFSINGSIKLNSEGNAVEKVTTRVGDGSGAFLKNRRRVLDTGLKNAMTGMKFPDSGAYAPESEGDETRIRRRGAQRAQRRGSKFINFTIKVTAGRIR